MKKPINFLRIAVALFSIAFASRAFSWGDDGHRIVGDIAWRFLQPETREEVSGLLLGAGESNLAEASTWADRIRSDDSYDWAAPLHYINLPTAWDGYREQRDCPPAGCILKAIDHFSSVLADRTATESARAEALLFVAHFVGDLHQPLHTGLAADRGGNDVQVSFFGFETNLHWLWDSKLPAGFIGDWRTYAEKASREVTPGQRRAWQASSPQDWAAESHRLAHRYAYTDKTALGEDYYLRNREVVAERLRQGGVRLAGLLEGTLGGE